MYGLAMHVGWGQILLRLALTLAAAAIFGLDRDVRGKPAGLRTTTLVGLAACVAMLEANLLLPTPGQPAHSFVSLDLMRLPLGILSGVGFLGAGTIIRRSNGVQGITTAATLWIVTVIGLCFGGGQLGLGAAASGLGIAVLWLFKKAEDRLNEARRGALIVTSRVPGAELVLPRLLEQEGIRITGQAMRFRARDARYKTRYELHWRARAGDVAPPGFLAMLDADPAILSYEWSPRTSGEF